MSRANNPREVLMATRWMLQRYGWCQGRSYISSKDFPNSMAYLDRSHIISGVYPLTHACLTGFLNLVECSEEDRRLALSQIQREVSRMTKGTIVTAISWNDIPSRTKKEVVSLLDKLIGGPIHE